MIAVEIEIYFDGRTPLPIDGPEVTPVCTTAEFVESTRIKNQYSKGKAGILITDTEAKRIVREAISACQEHNYSSVENYIRALSSEIEGYHVGMGIQRLEVMFHTIACDSEATIIWRRYR